MVSNFEAFARIAGSCMDSHIGPRPGLTFVMMDARAEDGYSGWVMASRVIVAPSSAVASFADNIGADTVDYSRRKMVDQLNSALPYLILASWESASPWDILPRHASTGSLGCNSSETSRYQSFQIDPSCYFAGADMD